jgi:23S rRNA pseudouridine1911/1915/1917 synthase
MNLEYIATNKDKNKTIKDILLSHFKISHRLLTTLKKEDSIFLNDSPSFIYKTVNENDKITISFDYEEDNSNIVSKEMPLDIIYEDDWLLVINKPSGISVHPSILHYEDSLSNGVKFYFDSIGLKKKIRPVNRIDKDTSGIVVFAKNEYVQELLIRQMQTGEFCKEYIAVVEGHFSETQKKRNN